jgi:hypothetical protein
MYGQALGGWLRAASGSGSGYGIGPDRVPRHRCDARDPGGVAVHLT